LDFEPFDSWGSVISSPKYHWNPSAFRSIVDYGGGCAPRSMVSRCTAPRTLHRGSLCPASAHLLVTCIQDLGPGDLHLSLNLLKNGICPESNPVSGLQTKT
jgi:hypothetical protein